MTILPSLRKGALFIIQTSHRSAILPTLIAELALSGPLTVLDGGNCFPAYQVAQSIRMKSTDINNISKRIYVRRAFTCYQVVNLLESAIASPHPHLILDLLSIFQDDQVQPREADRLLNLCLAHIERLRISAPVAISLSSSITAEKYFLQEKLYAKADEVFSDVKEFPKQAEQMSLFK